MKRHIFLIDDDVDELRIFTDALRELPESFQCTYAASGPQALKLLRQHSPHFIFIDYNLPGMNGIELLEQIRREYGGQDAHIFIYSTTVSEKTRGQALALGAADAIEKPASVRKMNALLWEVLGLGAEIQ